MRRAASSPLFRRGAAGIIDQSISLVSNFGLIAVLTRLTTGEQFGWYSALIITHRLLIMLNRGATTDPVNIACRGERVSVERHRRAVLRSSLASGAVLGFVGAAGLAVVLAGHPAQAAAVLFALGLPGLFVQDADRQLAFASRSPRMALRNDTIWTGTFCVGLVVSFVLGVDTALVVFASWVGGASVTAIIAWALPTVGTEDEQPIPAQLRWFTIGEAFLDRAGIQGSTLLVAVVVGWVDLGSLVAARTLLSPSNFLLFLVVSVGTAEVGALERAGRPRAARKLLFVSTIVLSIVPIAIAVAMHTSPIGRWLIGAKWESAAPLVIPTALFVSSTGIQYAMTVGLRSRQQVRSSLILRGATTFLLVAAPLIVAIRTGINGAAWAFAAAGLVAALLWIIAYSRATRSSGPDDTLPDVAVNRLVSNGELGDP